MYFKGNCNGYTLIHSLHSINGERTAYAVDIRSCGVWVGKEQLVVYSGLIQLEVCRCSRLVQPSQGFACISRHMTFILLYPLVSTVIISAHFPWIVFSTLFCRRCWQYNSIANDNYIYKLLDPINAIFPLEIWYYHGPISCTNGTSLGRNMQLITYLPPKQTLWLKLQLFAQARTCLIPTLYTNFTLEW